MQASPDSAYDTSKPLGIIAGKGDLPAHIIEAHKQTGQQVCIIALEGHTSAELVSGEDHQWCRIGAVGQAIEALRKREISQLVMAGHIKRPSLRDIIPDGKGRSLLKRLGSKLIAGDDALLSSITAFFEQEGFTIIGAHDICTNLLTDLGTLTTAKPETTDWEDQRKAVNLLKTISSFDVGQAVIMHQSHILGIEAMEGTAELIARCTPLKAEGEGVLVKMCKAGQEKRVDMPAIGVATVESLAKGGYRGMFIEAGATLMLGKQAVIEAANRYDLFIEGFNVEPDVNE